MARVLHTHDDKSTVGIQMYLHAPKGIRIRDPSVTAVEYSTHHTILGLGCNDTERSPFVEIWQIIVGVVEKVKGDKFPDKSGT
jgi:hypothetical protein